jgi:hypothetical protein
MGGYVNSDRALRPTYVTTLKHTFTGDGVEWLKYRRLMLVRFPTKHMYSCDRLNFVLRDLSI